MNKCYAACCALFCSIVIAPVASSQPHQSDELPVPVQPIHLTHGPILGRIGDSSIGVWARSSYPATMQVRYGTEPDKLNQTSGTIRTALSADNTGWVRLSGLTANTLYYYAVSFDGEVNNESGGSFRTLPDAAAEKNEDNPTGKFNFSFAATSCAKQSSWDSQGLGPYQTMLREQVDNVNFTLQLGDWLYETDRDWPVSKWQTASAPQGLSIPSKVANAPNLVGVWQNYKTYLEANSYMAEWHRRVPSYFAFDDHEVLNNFTDATVVGSRRRNSLFRDLGLQGWVDYLGWSNPDDSGDRIVFGRTDLRPGNDILLDPDADFRALRLDDESTLHIHWGGPYAGVNHDGVNKSEIEHAIEEAGPRDQNAGVYRIVEVVDQHRLRIFPVPKARSNSGYSIGVRHYYKFSASNSEFFVLDTRSYRKSPDASRQRKPEMLGRIQMDWLKDAMRNSKADVLFVVSPSSFSLPHLASAEPPGEDSSWTGFLADRSELLDFWKSLNRTVIIISGDMHDSYSIRWNERLWEFGAGPISSFNRESSAKTGWRPANGEFDSAGQLVDIRWSTYFKNGTPRNMRRAPVYAVFNVNNVYKSPSDNQATMAAFPIPQVVVQFFSALGGELLYAESVVMSNE